MFFENYQIDKKSKIGITHLLSNITTREGSHKGGWTRLLKCQLKNIGYDNVTILDNKNSLQEFDVIIFDLGAEFSGALNMFGGLDEKVFKRLKEIKDFNGPIYSWRNDLPSILSLDGRRTNASTCEAFKETAPTFLSEVQEVLSKVQVFQHTYQTSKILIGDSHTPSVWTPEFMIERRDGRTLKGMVEKGTIQKYLKSFQIDLGIKIETVHIHCGSIDVRHHLSRHSNPEQSTAGLVSELVTVAMSCFDGELIFTHTMGIEDESRELPKTGYFKNTPYFGSWEQRDRLRQIFNAVLDGCVETDPGRSSVIHFPKYFFDNSGKLRFDVMEKPQSVHLSPEHYRWDLDANKLRWDKFHDIKMMSNFGVKDMAKKLEEEMYGAQ